MGTTVRNVNLSKGQIERAKKRNGKGVSGPTFRSIGGGKFTCNQLPEIGHLSKTQVAQIERKVWHRNSQAKPTTKALPPTASPQRQGTLIKAGGLKIMVW
jgi:hypothetical protein